MRRRGLLPDMTRRGGTMLWGRRIWSGGAALGGIEPPARRRCHRRCRTPLVWGGEAGGALPPRRHGASPPGYFCREEAGGDRGIGPVLHTALRASRSRGLRW